jgi:hypothetical protein
MAQSSHKSSRGQHGRSTQASSSKSKSRSHGRGESRTTTSRSSTSKLTTDHDQIRKWVESRGGKPACVKGTGSKKDTGTLRLDFPGYSGEGKLQEISWDEFFEQFDASGLALLYQEKTKGGEKSNFNKLVNRAKA